MTPATTYTYQNLLVIINNLVSFLFRFAALAAVVAIVWFGLRMVMARGDATKFTEAKKGLQYALIGAVLIFGVWTIIATVQYFVNTLGGR